MLLGNLSVYILGISCLFTILPLCRIALAFGVTVATMAQSIGHISGCHINPAVTCGLLFGRKIGLVNAFLYIIAQCVGAILGGGLLFVSQDHEFQGTFDSKLSQPLSISDVYP